MITHIETSSIGGVAEVAHILDCPKPQIHALRKRADFPAPFMRIAATPLWDLEEVDRFKATWVRRRIL